MAKFNASRRYSLFILMGLAGAVTGHAVRGDDAVRTLTFDGVLSETKIAAKELALPADWSPYTHLVMEMRASSPQRFGLWIYTDDGLRRVEIQPFGQGAWVRASIPLQYFKGMESGTDLASVNNRRTDAFWMSVWGPFGALTSVQSIGFSMDYPIHQPTIELRNVHLAKQDEGSAFLETKPVRDEFGQWALTDWPRKIHSREQLDQEMAEERKALDVAADFGYDKYGGYAETRADATGFFRVEQVGGKWWFVDPDGHLFLSTGFNGTPGNLGRPGRGGATSAPGATQSATAAAPSVDAVRLTNLRLAAWGMTTGGAGRPNAIMLRWNLDRGTTFLGMPDVYADAFAQGIDTSAQAQCAARRNDPMVLGYFVGNEPPWGDRESDVVDMILAGPETATRGKLKEFLSAGDSPKRRKEFVIGAFEKYLDIVCAAVKKYDPNHLNLGIRFGSTPSDEMLRCGRVFDVCSINVYEYEPTKQVERSYRVTGRPILIGEFHIGVPENGLGAGLVQARDQTQRAIAYRYFVEQAASLDGFLGAHWFQWRDEPVLGRFDGENYNIGFVDVTDRPYPEMVEAAKVTNRRLLEVHSGKVGPFAQKPLASDVGAPSSPWDK